MTSSHKSMPDPMAEAPDFADIEAAAARLVGWAVETPLLNPPVRDRKLGNFVPHFEEIDEWAIDAAGDVVKACFRVDQLHDDSHRGTFDLDAAFDVHRHPKPLAYL